MTELHKIAYIEEWKGHYGQNILAGILMALALLPVAIAFSFIVHIKPTLGLMSCGLMMCLISLFGKRLAMVSGPSSGISIIDGPLVEQYGVHYLALATILMGMILFIYGLCHIDKILKLIPNTVVMGFMNALGLLLLWTQMKYIFGISIATYVVSALTFIIIFISSRTIKVIPAPLITIIVLTFATWLIHPNLQYVHDMADIHFSMPSIHIPQEMFELSAFFIALKYAFTMSIISVIQTNLTNDMMNMISQHPTNKDREIVGQGLSNIIVGLFGGYGSSGLIGQSKFNYRMGARTRVATLTTGIFLLLCVFVLGQLVGLIPMVVLASVLITISFNTFDRRTFQHIKGAPVKRGLVMGLTMILILITNNLAIGVIAGTLFYYILRLFFKKEGTE